MRNDDKKEGGRPPHPLLAPRSALGAHLLLLVSLLAAGCGGDGDGGGGGGGGPYYLDIDYDSYAYSNDAPTCTLYGRAPSSVDLTDLRNCPFGTAVFRPEAPVSWSNKTTGESGKGDSFYVRQYNPFWDKWYCESIWNAEVSLIEGGNVVEVTLALEGNLYIGTARVVREPAATPGSNGLTDASPVDGQAPAPASQDVGDPAAD